MKYNLYSSMSLLIPRSDINILITIQQGDAALISQCAVGWSGQQRLTKFINSFSFLLVYNALVHLIHSHIRPNHKPLRCKNPNNLNN